MPRNHNLIPTQNTGPAEECTCDQGECDASCPPNLILFKKLFALANELSHSTPREIIENEIDIFSKKHGVSPRFVWNTMIRFQNIIHQNKTKD